MARDRAHRVDVPPAEDPRLAVWEQKMNPVIVVAAILPIAVSFTKKGQDNPAVWLDLASWMVFIADFVVHVRWRPGYARSRLGRFDLTIVVLTAPWYVIPALGNVRVLGLARLGRLARVFVVSTKSRLLLALGRRLGRAALYGLALIVVCAVVVEAVEPESSGFESFGDSMWWAVVTFTTVGYGDYYPVTTSGRLAAVLLMLGGIALIGTLAGSLGSFFSSADESDESVEPVEPDEHDPPAVTGGDRSQELLAEVRALRTEIAELRRAVEHPRG